MPKIPKNASRNNAIARLVFKLTLSTKEININILFILIILNNLKKFECSHINSKGKYKLEEISVKSPFMTLRSACFNEEYQLEQINDDLDVLIGYLLVNILFIL